MKGLHSHEEIKNKPFPSNKLLPKPEDFEIELTTWLSVSTVYIFYLNNGYHDKL